MKHLEVSDDASLHPRAIEDRNGDLVSGYRIRSEDRFIRLLSWIPGRIYSEVNPQTDALRHSLGRVCGGITSKLSGFDHPGCHRKLDWDIAQGEWTTSHLELFSVERQTTLQHFLELFKTQKETYDQLRKSVVHNDANDNNLIVSADLQNPEVTSVVDFGDAIHTQVIQLSNRLY